MGIAGSATGSGVGKAIDRSVKGLREGRRLERREWTKAKVRMMNEMRKTKDWERKDDKVLIKLSATLVHDTLDSPTRGRHLFYVY